MTPRHAALLVAVALVGAASGEAVSAPLPGAPSCAVFPADSHWNLPVDGLPVAADSNAIIASIGLDEGLHADFGSGLYEGAPIGIPITVVGPRTARVRVRFEYADESDRVRYPIPRSVRIEGGRNGDGDRHAVIVDRSTCRLFELFALFPTAARGWRAGSGAVWNLRSNGLRPQGWTSADAAGLPLLPGLARFDEVARGLIDHALRFTVERSRSSYVYPASHFASDDDDPGLPPMGLRLRLRADFPVGDFPPQARVVLEALKRYGMLVADNGSDWFVSGAPHPGWDNDDLRELGRVKGSDFEVVDTSGLPRPAP